MALLVLIVPTASRIGHDADGQDAPQPAPVLPRRSSLLGGPVPAGRRVRLAGRLIRTLRAHDCHARRRPCSVVTAPSLRYRGVPLQVAGPAGTGNVLSMTDTEPGGAAPGPPGPPARPPGPVPDGYVPREWLQQRPRRRPHRRAAARRLPSALTTRRFPRLPPPPPSRPAGRASCPSSIPPGSPRRRSARAGCGCSTPSSASWSARSAR